MYVKGQLEWNLSTCFCDCNKDLFMQVDMHNLEAVTKKKIDFSVVHQIVSQQFNTIWEKIY